MSPCVASGNTSGPPFHCPLFCGIMLCQSNTPVSLSHCFCLLIVLCASIVLCVLIVHCVLIVLCVLALCCFRETHLWLFLSLFSLCPHFVSAETILLSSCLYNLQLGRNKSLVLFPHLQVSSLLSITEI